MTEPVTDQARWKVGFDMLHRGLHNPTPEGAGLKSQSSVGFESFAFGTM